MITIKVKNVGIFLVIFLLFFGLSIGNLNDRFNLVSFAQETEKAGETEGEDLSLNADSINYNRIDGEDLIIAQNNVKLKYQDIEVNTDYLKINLTTHLLFASGNVYFKQNETKTYCEELSYNWKNEKTILIKLKSELTAKGVKGNIYYQGEKMENFHDTMNIYGGNFTTCDLEEPHYHIVAKEMIIYPKDKIIARNISWYEGKIKIFTLPYFLIFLDRKTQEPLLPKIGQNSSDGWFIKTFFSYFFNEKSYGMVYVDWMQKKGIGTGIKHTIEIGEEDDNPGKASLYLYQLKAKNSDNFNITGNLVYEQNILKDIKTQFTLNYGGSISPGEALVCDSIKSQFNLKYDKKGENYNLALTSKYKFTGIELKDLDIKGNTTLKHNYTFNNKLGSALTLIYIDSNPNDREADRELKSKLNFTFKGDGYNLNLLTTKQFDIDGDKYTGENTSKIINRLPEFTFKKNNTSIGNTKITYNLEGSVGRFYEGATEEENTRGEYIINLKRPFNLGKYLTLTPSGIFRQDVYLTGEARYLAGGKLDLRAAYSPYISSTLSYSYNRSDGPTPFNFDSIAELSNTASAKLTLKPSEKFRLDLSTNYNFITEKYGNLVGKLEFKPKDKWKMNFSTYYNLNTKEWTKKVNSTLDLQVTDDWRIKYKGVVDLKDFKLTKSVIGITRDLHCRELTLNYKQATKSFWVEFFIKAFPEEKITLGGK